MTFLEACLRVERRGLEDGVFRLDARGTGEEGGLEDGELTSTTSYTLEGVFWNGTGEDGEDTDGYSIGSMNEGSPGLIGSSGGTAEDDE